MSFIDRHPKLAGVAVLCATYFGTFIAHRKHIEHVNEQRLEAYKAFQGTQEDKVEFAKTFTDSDHPNGMKGDS